MWNSTYSTNSPSLQITLRCKRIHVSKFTQLTSVWGWQRRQFHKDQSICEGRENLQLAQTILPLFPLLWREDYWEIKDKTYTKRKQIIAEQENSSVSRMFQLGSTKLELQHFFLTCGKKKGYTGLFLFPIWVKYGWWVGWSRNATWQASLVLEN